MDTEISPVEQLPQHVVHGLAVLLRLRRGIGLRRCGLGRGCRAWRWRREAAALAPALARTLTGSLTGSLAQSLLQQIAQGLAELAAERIGQSATARSAAAQAAEPFQPAGSE